MARGSLVSELAASLTALEKERGGIPEPRYAKRRRSILSELTSRSGLSNESTAGAVILLQSVIGGATLIAVKLPAETRVTVGIPVLVVAVAAALLVMRRLRRKQADRRPERLQAVEELRALELVGAQEAEELLSKIAGEKDA